MAGCATGSLPRSIGVPPVKDCMAGMGHAQAEEFAPEFHCSTRKLAPHAICLQKQLSNPSARWFPLAIS